MKRISVILIAVLLIVGVSFAINWDYILNVMLNPMALYPTGYEPSCPETYHGYPVDYCVVSAETFDKCPSGCGGCEIGLPSCKLQPGQTNPFTESETEHFITYVDESDYDPACPPAACGHSGQLVCGASDDLYKCSKDADGCWDTKRYKTCQYGCKTRDGTGQCREESGRKTCQQAYGEYEECSASGTQCRWITSYKNVCGAEWVKDCRTCTPSGCPAVCGFKIDGKECKQDCGCDYDASKYTYYDTVEACLIDCGADCTSANGNGDGEIPIGYIIVGIGAVILIIALASRGGRRSIIVVGK